MKLLKIDKKRMLSNLVIIIVVYLIAILADQITKNAIFRWNSTHNGGNFEVVANWRVIAFRSVGNNGAMLGLWSGKTTLIQVIALSVTLLTMIISLFSKNKLMVIALAFIGAGSLGNAIDRFAFQGMVKDIIYAPWWSNAGTFNLADTWVIVGAALFFIYSIIQLVKKEEPKTTIKN